MTVEYNVVILGEGPVARYAAEYGRSLNARVALVVGLSSQSPHSYPTGVYSDTMAIQTLRHIGQSLPTYHHGPYQAGALLFPGLPSSKGSRRGGETGTRRSPIQNPKSKIQNQPTPSPSKEGDRSIPTPQRPNAPTPQSKIQNPKSKIPWPPLHSLTQTLVGGQFEARSLSDLERLGVDVVYANDVDQADDIHDPLDSPVEFSEDSTIVLKTSRRRLSAQAYVIAMDGDPICPVIPGLEQVSYSTLDTFFHPESSVNWDSILIVGHNQQGIEAAWALAALGMTVTLVMDIQGIVQDEETDQWLTSTLGSVGVRVYWGRSVVRVDDRDGQCVAQLQMCHDPGTKAEIENANETTEVIADHLLLAVGRRVDFTALQLGGVGVAYDAQGIRVNSRYQSSHPRLFACGDAIGSPPSLNQRYGEVAIAVHHALFDQPLWSNAWLSTLLLRGVKQWLNPVLPPKPEAIPTVINIHPPLAYIGYGEAEVRQRYGNSWQGRKAERFTILRQPYGAFDQAQLLGAHSPLSTTGWCKLLVLENGQIVGAYIWGVQAEEVIGVISLAMHHSIPMEELGQLCPPMPSITAEVLQGLGLQWERERIKRRSLLFDWLELFFNWQRDWTR